MLSCRQLCCHSGDFERLLHHVSCNSADGAASLHRVDRRILRRVVLATIIGSVIEAFDWLAYGTAAALVFNKLFFPSFDAATSSLAAFSTFAAGFFARPVGG